MKTLEARNWGAMKEGAHMNRQMKTGFAHGMVVGMFVLMMAGPAWGLTISGTVRLQDGTPVPGVTMKGLPDNPITDDNGAYTSTVTAGWSGTVTPTEINFVFDPETRTYTSVTSDQANQDYTALQRTVSIYGYVRTAAGAGIADVVLSGPPASATTDPNGYYQFFVLRGWTGTITPAKTGYTFEPASASYTNLTENTGPADYVGTVSQSGGDQTGGGSTTGGSTSGDPNSGTSGSTDGGTTDGTTDGTSGGTGGDTSGDGTSDTQDGGTTEGAPTGCGAGACGAGVVGWLPMSIVAWCGLKINASLRRHGTRRASH